MNDWRLIIGLIFFMCLIGDYFIEVVFGSCPEIYDAELGLAATCSKKKRLSPKEFFSCYLPFLLALICLPLSIAWLL